jgi:acyl-coenzyme A thioesterase PaaI-like protein
LNVRFLKPLSPGQEVSVTGELTANRKGKIFEAKSSLRNAADEILAEGSGKYLPIKPTAVSEMAADFVGDASWLTEKPA